MIFGVRGMRGPDFIHPKSIDRTNNGDKMKKFSEWMEMKEQATNAQPENNGNQKKKIKFSNYYRSAYDGYGGLSGMKEKPELKATTSAKWKGR